MDVDLTAVLPEKGLYGSVTIADITAGILTPTHDCAVELEDTETGCHTVEIDLAKLPAGTKKLELRIMP